MLSVDYGIHFPGPLGGAANYCAEHVTDEDTKAALSLALETCRWAGFEPGSLTPLFVHVHAACLSVASRPAHPKHTGCPLQRQIPAPDLDRSKESLRRPATPEKPLLTCTRGHCFALSSVRFSCSELCSQHLASSGTCVST